MEEAKSHQSVNWYDYFKSIRTECPWSYSAYLKGKIRIVEYQGTREQLGDSEAIIYIVNAPNETIEALAYSFDSQDSECEWLFSYPGYGEFASPVGILIQQHRARLNQIREKLNASS